MPDVVLSSAYDANGDRISLAATIGGTADFQNTYAYDGVGNESSALQQGQSVSGANTVAYKQANFTYNSDNQLTALAAYGAASSEGHSLSETFGYNHDGNLTSQSDYGYYSGGDVQLEGLGMTYDADQRLTEAASSIHSAEDQYNTYDHDSQLINSSATGFDSGGSSYGYTSNGNISGSGDSVGDGNAQLAANGYSYTYDAAGNMKTQTDASGNVTTYVWDNRNRLTSATTVNSSDETVQVVDYTYDARNQLIGESVTAGGATTAQRFVYDPLTGEMQLAFNGSGSLTDRYLWGPLVDQVLADEKVTLLSSAGTVEWMATNNQGSVTDVWEYGASATLLDHIAYDAFGGIASQTNPANAPRFGYDGEYTDPATGLQLHDLRWYNPNAQAWMSKDPIFPLSGPNPYEYCGNDPTSCVDPSGLYPPGLYGGMGPNMGPSWEHGKPSGSGAAQQQAQKWTFPPIPPNPSTPPASGWKWDGPPGSAPGDPQGHWEGPCGEKLHPDLNHGPPKGPHWGLTFPGKNHWDYFPNTGQWVPDPRNRPGRPGFNPLPYVPYVAAGAGALTAGALIGDIIADFWPAIFAL